MKFAKLHGLGNDFLVVNVAGDARPNLPYGSLARRLCERRSGVGADGILFYQGTLGDRDADASVLIFNADGSRAEMSGNGIRCLAAYLLHSDEVTKDEIRIRTVSGVKSLKLQSRDGIRYFYECSMGAPILEPRHIPCTLTHLKPPIIDHALVVGSRSVSVTITSMGNPHCTTFWEDVEGAPVDSLGPALENHSIFPNRSNVEFAQVLDRRRMRVCFWERGVGRTLSSGTGSSAAAAAAILSRRAESPVTVETTLGSLLVRWNGSDELFLTGPAEFICSGDYPL